MAAESNRLVLIHFWASSCTGCLKMEKEVFSRPDVAAALEANYVPVKLNADYFPNTARQYGVTALPTDVVLTPQGQPVETLVGFKSGPEYITAMNWIANKVNAAGQPTSGRLAAAVPNPPYAQRADASVAGRPAEAAGPERWAPRSANERPSQPGEVVVPPSPANPYAAQNPTPPSTASAPPSVYPFGLDSYCAVSLNERKQWVRGDRRWGAIHQGKTYLFAGPEEQQRFLQSPDLYAPVLAGNDPVLMVDLGQVMPGQRRYGAWYGDRVYLFSSEATLHKFSAEAHRYSNAVLQSMRPTPNTSYR